MQSGVSEQVFAQGQLDVTSVMLLVHDRLVRLVCLVSVFVTMLATMFAAVTVALSLVTLASLEVLDERRGLASNVTIEHRDADGCAKAMEISSVRVA